FASLQPISRALPANQARAATPMIGSTFERPRSFMPSNTVRVAAVGDLHCTRTSQGAFQALFARVAEAAEILLIPGDLTDYGNPDEARVLARELTALRIPVVAVLGNHDVESGKEGEVRQI